jgi:hypothetical protein
MNDDVFARAEKRRTRALNILERLDLLSRWSRYGDPVIVGAMSFGLMVALDIDMEIYSHDPRIQHGFELLSKVARLPGVHQVRFSNELTGPDQGLYWQIRFRDQEGETWKVDSWLLGHDHPHAHWAEKFTQAMQNALTAETRGAILEIKEALLGESGIRGLDIYKAVLEGQVRRPEEFRRWIKAHKPPRIDLWLPLAQTEP